MGNVYFNQSFLPTPYRSNHASNLMPLGNGDILCTWFAGTNEGRPDVYILMSRLKSGTSSWTEPIIVSGDSTRSEQNPVLFPDLNGTLWLFYTAQQDYDQGTSVVRYRTSKDCGHTWSGIKVLFDKPGTFIRQPLVILDNGNWLFPMYYSDKTASYGEDHSAVKISSDWGKTWAEYEVPGGKGLVQMNVLKMHDGTLHAYFRSRRADRIYTSDSEDNGRTWSLPVSTELLNNNSSIQATVLNNGHLAMVFNNICSDKYPTKGAGGGNSKECQSDGNPIGHAVWGTPRAPLTVAISEDGGKTWPFMRDLEADAEKLPGGNTEGKSKGEYSYPSVKQTPDDKIHITYTCLRDRIKYVCITEEWVKDASAV